VQRQAGIPDRRQAGLAITHAVLEDQELIHRLARRGAVRVIAGVAQGVEGHEAVGHGGENAAEAVFAVEPLLDEGYGLVDGDVFQKPRHVRLNQPGDLVQGQKHGADPMAGGVMNIVCFLIGGTDEQFPDPDAARIPGPGFFRRQYQKRHHHGPRPIGNLVDMKQRPFGQQHGFDPHHRDGPPGNMAEKRQGEPGKDVRARRAAVTENGFAGADHMGASISSPVSLSAK